jgi:DMSO/TMAO reductase YedYZ heme-binding membrane subunit
LAARIVEALRTTRRSRERVLLARAARSMARPALPFGRREIQRLAACEREVVMNGWRLLFWLFVAMAAANLALFALGATEVSGLRMVIKVTARTSLTLFCLAFGASAFHRLWPNARTCWQLRNRRYLGLGFALSHAIHLAAVITLCEADRELFRSLTQPAGIILGTITYLMIAIMAATSFDGAVRLLGPSRWRLLHLIAGYEIWAQFMISTGRRVVTQPFYLVFVAMLVAVFAARMAAMANRRTAVGAL